MQQEISSVAIIGAGAMGRSIAALNVEHGIPVTITDACPDAINTTVQLLNERVDKRSDNTRPRITEWRTDRLVHVAKDAADLARSDLIIEAVAEKRRVKRQCFAALAPHLKPNTIVSTNTSSIPLDQMLDCLPHRTRFCGLHFCYPVDQRSLVEVVRCENASDETIAAVIHYAQRIGKNPVVVQDKPGFVVNRLLVPYLNEALELILEGAAVGDIEQAAVAFGMPIGPLHQLDQFGIDVALQTGLTLYKSFPERVPASPLLTAMYTAGHFGRKTGSGFFDARDDANNAQLTPEATELIEQFRRDQRSFAPEYITRRLFLPMLLESLRIVDENVVDRAEDVDIALRGGLDFGTSFGGLLRWSDSIGARTILSWLVPLQELGPRFHPTPLLLGLADRDDQILSAA